MKRKRTKLVVSALVGASLAALISISTTLARPIAVAPPPSIAERATETMSALGRAPSAADRAVGVAASRDVQALLAGGAGRQDNPGRAVPGSTRVLLDRLGADAHVLYAVRTDRGRVCGGLVGVAAGCFEGFAAESPINWTIGGKQGGVTTVFGFIPNRVEAVKILLKDRSLTAQIGSNAFFAEIADASPAMVTGLLVTFRNGSTTQVSIDLNRPR
jgi:hypothetical protein